MAELNNQYAHCISSELDAASIMNNMTLGNIQSLLRRMNIDFVEGLPAEAYHIAFQDEFCSDREWILRIFPKRFLDLLIKIWESDKIEMDDEGWDILQYFKSFGILTFKRANKHHGDENEIYIVEAIRKNFYFYIKSKDSKKKMMEYERWDDAFCGMTYYYGMIPLTYLHGLFCQVLGIDTDYDSFYTFIKCRADVWGLGNFLKDGKGMEYFQNHSVEEPEITYLYLMDRDELPYRLISYEDLKYVKEAYGIDNRWAGISDLGNFLVEEMNISYYRATVLVHGILTAIQNSKSYEQIKGMFDVISFDDQRQKDRALDYLHILYYHIPIYEYKGHSRTEYERIMKEEEWHRRRDIFTMLPGGK